MGKEKKERSPEYDPKVKFEGNLEQMIKIAGNTTLKNTVKKPVDNTKEAK